MLGRYPAGILSLDILRGPLCRAAACGSDRQPPGSNAGGMEVELMHPEPLAQLWCLAKDWGHGIAEGKDCGPIVSKNRGVVVFRPCRAGDPREAWEVCNASIRQSVLGFLGSGLGNIGLLGYM